MFLLIVGLFCLFFNDVSSDTNVVTNNPICTDIADKYIKRHPNITSPELFIITSMCEGIVHPMDSGLGGGFQAVIHKEGTKKSWYVNSRERAGSNHRFPSKPGKTAKHIGVPSMLKGYEHLYTHIRDYGYKHGPVLAWRDLFKENIKLAKRGFTMSRTLMNVIHAIDLSNSPWRYNKTTQKLMSPKLGNWLENLSKQQPGNLSFYKNRAKENDILMDELREIGSSLIRSDIVNYNVYSKTANAIDCLDFRMYTSKIPGSGAVHMFGCKVLEYAIKHYKYHNWSSSKRFIFNIRLLQYMQTIQQHLKHLSHKSAVKNQSLIRNLIERDSRYVAKFLFFYKLPLSLYPPTRIGKTKLSKNQLTINQKTVERGTSNICIKDSRTTFCATSTINWGFGSGIASRHFGFFYNNQLSDFTYQNDESYNRPLAGKQPLSSISPIIFTKKSNDKMEFALGAAGGRKIIPSIFTIMSEFLYEHEHHKENSHKTQYNCDKDQYIPRCVFHLKPFEQSTYTFLECEDTLNRLNRETLSNFKAIVKYSVEAGYSSVTVLTKTHGCYDPRRGGKSLK